MTASNPDRMTETIITLERRQPLDLDAPRMTTAELDERFARRRERDELDADPAAINWPVVFDVLGTVAAIALLIAVLFAFAAMAATP